jgi:GNAT superfamily N-acetyltransferase
MRANEFIIEYRKNAMVGGIDLSFEYDDKFGESARVQAFSNGRKLGYAEFLVVKDNELEATDLEVDERYRGQGIARLMYDFVKQQGYKIHRSHAQTMDGHAFWNKNRGEERVWEDELSEISRDRLERYLSRATRQVDSRQERMALARQRLNTSYEIYRAEEPTKIVDRFEADTPADAQRYYQDYIERYQSDVDYDLRLRRATGIDENFADGKVKGKSRPGRVKRAGASCNGSVTDLRRKAKNASGEKAKMYHWCANMKSGRKK